jgi:hypothetical protein
LSFAEAKKPKTEFDKTIDFKQFKTYAWVQGYPVPNPVANQLLMAAVDAELRQLGLRKVDDPNSSVDLLVRYDARVDYQTGSIAVDPLYTASGGVPTPSATYSNIWNQGSAVMSAVEGSLQVRLLDTVRQKVVWGSSVDEKIEQKSSKRLTQINRIIADMFSAYPVKKAAD